MCSSDAVGKTAVVTGGNSGIGKETVLELVRSGKYGRIFMPCRNVESGLKAKEDIQKATLKGGSETELIVSSCDLSSFDSIRKFADEYKSASTSCDLLVNNAGVMMIPELRYTADGYEEHLGVNFLSHFLLTSLMLDSLAASQAPRIINVSSAANSFGKFDFDDMNYAGANRYDPWQAYGNSKLANLVFTFELHRRLREAGLGHVATNAVHPGLVATNLGRHMNQFSVQFLSLFTGLFVLTPEEGARVQVDLSLAPRFEGVSGRYYADQTFKFNRGVYKEEDVMISKQAKDAAVASKLWEYGNETTKASWEPLEGAAKQKAKQTVEAPTQG